MFNHEEYVKRADAMRADIEASPDQAWRETVDMRYARFIANNAMVKTAAALQALELEPLLDLSLRLGEGTGAALAFGVIDASLKLLSEMATFGEAGVDEKKNADKKTPSPKAVS